MISAKLQSPKERIARALCRLDGQSETAALHGVPQWRAYEEEALHVLAALEVSPLLEVLKEIELNDAVPTDLRDKAHVASARFVGLT